MMIFHVLLSFASLLLRNSMSDGGNTTTIFGEILSEIYLDETLSDLKNVVQIIFHFFHTRNRRVEVLLMKSKQLDIQKRDDRVVKEKLSLCTEVLIKDKFIGSLVKMQCPDRTTLETHSRRLALLMVLQQVSSASFALIDKSSCVASALNSSKMYPSCC
jgi:hypothetical protein